MQVARWWVGRGVDVGVRPADIVLPLEHREPTGNGTWTAQTEHQRPLHTLFVVQAALVQDSHARVIGWDWVFLNTYVSVHGGEWARFGQVSNQPPQHMALPTGALWAIQAVWRLSDPPFDEPAPKAEVRLWLGKESSHESR